MAPDYSQAPQVTAIEFSAPSLAMEQDPTTEFVVRATVSDTQGTGDIEFVAAQYLFEGLAHPGWYQQVPWTAELYDDGTHGDEVSGDGVFTSDQVEPPTYDGFYERYPLPTEVGFRIMAKDPDGNYGVADTTLLLVAE